MICPKCKYEYRDDIKICPDCGEELVFETEKEQEFNPDEKVCVIYTASDEFEADIIIAKLASEGIYASKKFKGSDSYSRIILGRTMLGVDILIAESDKDEAVEIIKS